MDRVSTVLAKHRENKMIFYCLYRWFWLHWLHLCVQNILHSLANAIIRWFRTSCAVVHFWSFPTSFYFDSFAVAIEFMSLLLGFSVCFFFGSILYWHCARYTPYSNIYALHYLVPISGRYARCLCSLHH